MTPDGTNLTPWLALAGGCVPALAAAAEPDRLRAALRGALDGGDAASLGRHLTEAQLALLGRAVHLGVPSDALLSLLDGSLGLPAPPGAPTPVAAGAGLPYLPLAGVLGTRFGHDARELGGPVTEALVRAAQRTVPRVAELEARCRAAHREVVLLKSTLSAARQHEQERVDAALRAQQRAIARRGARAPSLLQQFVATRWGACFAPLGTSEDLPRVLRTTAPVNNK